MRASSLSYNTIAVNREIDSAYDAVLEVRDNLTSIAIVAGLDIDTIIADLHNAKDFTGIKVAVGSVASWDSVTKTITVPVVKGDTGDKGESGVDGVQGPVGETGPRGIQGIQGNKGDKGDVGPEGQQGLTGNTGPRGDTGLGVHHSRATSTTNHEGNFSISGETDTYTIYGDADETVVLGEFNVSNGSSAYTYAVSAGYTGTSTQFYSELAAVRIYSEQSQLNANSAAASASQAVITTGQATTAASASSSSASSASASASIATTKASEASTSAAAALVSETNANTSKNTAATAATTATTKASEASTSASNASTSATNAATSASAASVSASTSATKATEAAASASTALGYKNDVNTMKLAIETIYDTFDDRFLGTKTTNPSVDNDGNALIDGALFFDTTTNTMKVYDAGTTTWYAMPQIYLNSLLDVQLTSLTTGHILVWNGTKWANGVVSKASLGLANVDNTSDATKNVLSATKLTTARTIGGVSFDGTANINLAGVNTTGTQSTSGNAATATKLQTARLISLSGDVTGSASFDGSSNISINTSSSGAAAVTGTFTPSLVGALGGGATYEYALGTYTKISNLVYFDISIKTLTCNFSTGISVVGLPFVRKNIGNEVSIVPVSLDRYTFSGSGVIGQIKSNTSTITLLSVKTGNTPSSITCTSDVSILSISGVYPV